MSTRSTIWHSEELGIHLYLELMDGQICLEISRGGFCVDINIPPEMIAAIKNHKLSAWLKE